MTLAIVDSRDSVVGLCVKPMAAWRRIARATQWPGNPESLIWEEVREWFETHDEITVAVGLSDITREPIHETYRIIPRAEVVEVNRGEPDHG